MSREQVVDLIKSEKRSVCIYYTVIVYVCVHHKPYSVDFHRCTLWLYISWMGSISVLQNLFSLTELAARKAVKIVGFLHLPQKSLLKNVELVQINTENYILQTVLQYYWKCLSGDRECCETQEVTSVSVSRYAT